ncbi:MAG: CopG family transcriptional regulator [Ignavibacteria bacterium]
MKSNTTFTSSINTKVMKRLRGYSDKYKMPKNKIIEDALLKYFDELKKAEYISSFKRANKDTEMLQMAEEGLEDYLQILDRKN